MEIINKQVLHKKFGKGKIVDLNDSEIKIAFSDREIKFIFPNAFSSFLEADDKELSKYISNLLEEKQLKEQERLKQKIDEMYLINDDMQKKVLPNKNQISYKQNIAFKCNFCDGGISDEQVGFNGVCSDNLIYNNIKVEHRTWCTAKNCDCISYYNGMISRKELDNICKKGGYVCYESQLLREWKAFAGVIQNGEKKSKPMKLKNIQKNSLCILTTREPNQTEKDRYIFAAFLVDETYEGDTEDEGFVSTKSEYKIKLAPDEAHSLLFWNYHTNDKSPEKPAWNSGLHRYFEDVQAAQILKDIVLIKKGTKDEALADKFLKYFCSINKVNIENIPKSNGTLIKY